MSQHGKNVGDAERDTPYRGLRRRKPPVCVPIEVHRPRGPARVRDRADAGTCLSTLRPGHNAYIRTLTRHHDRSD